MKLYDDLQSCDTIEVLVAINKLLNVAHQRSDFSEIFIVGGNSSLDAISSENKNMKLLYR